MASLKCSSKATKKNKNFPENLLTNAQKCAIIKSQKDKDSPKNQKGYDTMANKVTKMDKFNALLALDEVQANSALVDFIKHEMELLANKNAKRSDKPTAAQKENAEIADEVPNVMESGKKYRLSEIKALIPKLASASGTQRIAAICRKLEDSGVLVKTVDKRVIYYSLAD